MNRDCAFDSGQARLSWRRRGGTLRFAKRNATCPSQGTALSRQVICGLWLFGFVLLQAEPIPAFIDYAAGNVSINGQKAEAGTYLPPVPCRLQTGAASSLTVVLANGLTIYLAPDSALEVSYATMEPVDRPKYAGRPFEDIITHITLQLSHGHFGFSQPDPDPQSTLVLRTPYGELESDAVACFVELGGTKHFAGALAGTLNYRHKGRERFISEGEQINLAEAALAGSPRAISRLDIEEQLRAEEWTRLAQFARERRLWQPNAADKWICKAVLRPEDLSGPAYNDYLLLK